jgi:hypothetical protein
MDPTSDQRLLQGSGVKLLYYIEIDLSRLQTSIPSESGSFNQWPLHTAAVQTTANKTPVFGDFIVRKICVWHTQVLYLKDMSATCSTHRLHLTNIIEILLDLGYM